MAARSLRSLEMALLPPASSPRARTDGAPRRGGVACTSTAVWLAGLLGGCASLPPPPASPPRSGPPLRGLADDHVPDGALRPGDRLNLEVTSGDEASVATGVVDARGYVHVTPGSDVEVSGLSLKSAEQRLGEVVHQRDRFAIIDLQFAARPTERVSVLGALAKPGYIELTPGMRVVDILAAAGGLLAESTSASTASSPAAPGRTAEAGAVAAPVADLADAVLVRNGKALPIDFEQALRGAPGHNVLVHPGDQIYVPFAAGNLVSVLGQVGRPMVLAHRSGLRLTEALAAAGGLTEGGNASDIRLVRGPPDAPKVYRANLGAIASGSQHDAALAPGDVLFVTDDPIEDVREVLGLLAPLATIGFAVLLVYLVFVP